MHLGFELVEERVISFFPEEPEVSIHATGADWQIVPETVALTSSYLVGNQGRETCRGNGSG